MCGAAAGSESDREAFVGLYLPVVRAYLAARWRGGAYLTDIDDAVQDTFVDCFREGGALGRADPAKRGRFRTFLYAVVRNIALRHEKKRARERARVVPGDPAEKEIAANDDRLSLVFDRAWARALLQSAVGRQRTHAEAKGEAALLDFISSGRAALAR